jgi:hypothetical protein
MHPKKRKLDLTKYGLDDKPVDSTASHTAAAASGGDRTSPLPQTSQAGEGNAAVGRQPYIAATAADGHLSRPGSSVQAAHNQDIHGNHSTGHREELYGQEQAATSSQPGDQPGSQHNNNNNKIMDLSINTSASSANNSSSVEPEAINYSSLKSKSYLESSSQPLRGGSYEVTVSQPPRSSSPAHQTSSVTSRSFTSPGTSVRSNFSSPVLSKAYDQPAVSGFWSSQSPQQLSYTSRHNAAISSSNKQQGISRTALISP